MSRRDERIYKRTSARRKRLWAGVADGGKHRQSKPDRKEDARFACDIISAIFIALFASLNLLLQKKFRQSMIFGKVTFGYRYADG